MKRYDLIVIGAGPAGLSAAIEGAKSGMRVIVFDENEKPGGQLFKQIHKFFGSKEHHAKIRGINIGKDLLEEASSLNVEVCLSATVIGIFPEKCVSVSIDDHIHSYRANSIIIATGASERMIPFKGWTLPGVMGAGACQTMMNIHGVQPGEKILMVGSGNVGLVVGYQLLQAGCDLKAVIDVSPHVGGYGVHASKLTRTGVPFYLSHTVIEAKGSTHVTSAIISEVDSKYQPIPGSEKEIDVDTICVAVGLNPMNQLVKMTGAEMIDKGGMVPVCDRYGSTSIPGIFVAGDVSGIEEASSAMIEGHIAGLAAAKYTGFIGSNEFEQKVIFFDSSLGKLHRGMFAPQNKGKKQTKTDEGFPLSETLLSKGYMSESEAISFPGYSSSSTLHPVIECSQNIPCNPCQDACSFNCIQVGENITDLPKVNPKSKCRNCGMCVAACPGQAIFLVDKNYHDGYASITLPYEFLPVPPKGTQGKALDRGGKEICEAEVLDIKALPAFDKTVLLTMKVPSEYADQARFFRRS